MMAFNINDTWHDGNQHNDTLQSIKSDTYYKDT